MRARDDPRRRRRQGEAQRFIATLSRQPIEALAARRGPAVYALYLSRDLVLRLSRLSRPPGRRL